jgi:hypothetical protein
MPDQPRAVADCPLVEHAYPLLGRRACPQRATLTEAEGSKEVIWIFLFAHSHVIHYFLFGLAASASIPPAACPGAREAPLDLLKCTHQPTESQFHVFEGSSETTAPAFSADSADTFPWPSPFLARLSSAAGAL